MNENNKTKKNIKPKINKQSFILEDKIEKFKQMIASFKRRKCNQVVEFLEEELSLYTKIKENKEEENK